MNLLLICFERMTREIPIELKMEFFSFLKEKYVMKLSIKALEGDK